ncbi:MAG: putative collagen-binding domain-containing protein [Bryobacteraceae bacterium]
MSASRIKASWYDPRAGVTSGAGTFEKKGQDWVLILDGAAKGYRTPEVEL